MLCGSAQAMILSNGLARQRRRSSEESARPSNLSIAQSKEQVQLLFLRATFSIQKKVCVHLKERTYDCSSEESDIECDEDINEFDDCCDESYDCLACNLQFDTEELYYEHATQHKVCGIEGCAFEGGEDVMESHISMQHASGLYGKICTGSTPEEIEKWRAERKKNYPTKENVELRYKKQEEMIKRGERIKEKKKRFADKKSNVSKIIKKKKPRPIKRQQQKSLIDDKSDWNEGMFPFRGTGQIYESAESEKEFDDSEWSNENIPAPSTKPCHQKLSLSNALGVLMGAYGSDESDCEDDDSQTNAQCDNSTNRTSNICDNSCTQRDNSDGNQTDVKEGGETGDFRKRNNEGNNTKQVKEGNNSKSDESKDGEKLVSDNINEANNEIESNNFEAEKSEINESHENNETAETEKNTSPIINKESENSNNFEDDDRVIEEKISKQPVSVYLPPETKPTDPEMKGNKRGKKNRKHNKSNKKPRLDKPNEPRFVKRVPTLLEKLLEKEIRHERNVLLQCVRFVVENNFFNKQS